MSFRLRLLATSLLTLVVGLGALLVAGNVILERRVDSETTSLLHARAQAQVAALTVKPTGIIVRDTPNDTLLDRQSWVLDGQRVIERPTGAQPAVDKAAVVLGRAGRRTEENGPHDTRVFALPLRAHGSSRPKGAVVVALSVRPLERLEQEVFVGSLVIAALVLLAGWLAVRGALEGALRPVAQMTASAEAWGAHDLERRFDLGQVRDELTGLAATLDHLLARIAASRRHEQRFASEVAHELRTPLAALRARAELALESEAEGEEHAALETVIEQADRLEGTIDSLMAVARQELDPSVGTTDLAELARSFDDV